MSRRRNWVAPILGAILLYFIVAGVTFALRHPWMTETERMLWFGRALAFGKVTQDEVRGSQR